MTDSQVDQPSFENRYAEYDYDPTYYDPGDIDQDLRRRRAQSADERTSWGYLGVLCLVFLGLVASARACEALEDAPTVSEVVVDETGVSITNPVRLAIEVEGDIITLRGSVPDELFREELVATVETF
ncbi:MAG: hypothetical protein OER95_18105, partial [Acidimicrobiia bacterium]|nr:hypothetical protein [Acidimicrobiia bacterium]